MAKRLDDIIREMQRMGHEVERLCEGFFTPPDIGGGLSGRHWRPPSDVYETDDALVIRMAISGLDAARTEIWAQGEQLIIRGRREEKCPHQKVAFHQMEVHYGYFERVLRLPHSYEPDRIEATYSEGFLQILIPKSARPASGPRRVSISGTRSEGAL